MIRKTITAIILAALFSSCHIYRAYERPESVTVSDSLYREPVSASDSVSLASLTWRELFRDSQLQNAPSRILEVL